jgi:pyruvate formate lyase activating enzyme
MYMGKCIRCGEESILISSALDVCAACIRNHFDDVRPHLEKVHAKSRSIFSLPFRPPKEDKGILCQFCVNQCQILPGEMGFCGTRFNTGEKLIGGRPHEGNLSWYYDPLPTNCVGTWICPGGTSCGYPDYSYSKTAEYGYKNQSVFFHSCTFNCLFCQNWHFRAHSAKRGKKGPDFIVDGVDKETACICYFGGDPTPQLPYAIHASKLALEKNKGRILRICWETNGAMNPKLLEKMAELSLSSGGCVKFDLKAWDEKLHFALCGTSNHWTFFNFERLAGLIPKRPDPPFLTASTLLVPGYIDEQEVGQISAFIASLDRDIPYSLLAFYPRFQMQDLPPTSRNQARRCMEAARTAGLRRIKVGNLHLLI